MARMNGGEVMARMLKAAGAEYIFGIAVGSQSPLVMAAIKLGINMVTVRDEKDAALMATAYGRVSGKPGICLASGPGAAHLARIIHPPLSLGQWTLKKRMDVYDSSPNNPFSPCRSHGYVPPRVLNHLPRLCRATSGHTSILVDHLDHGSHEFKST